MLLKLGSFVFLFTAEKISTSSRDISCIVMYSCIQFNRNQATRKVPKNTLKSDHNCKLFPNYGYADHPSPLRSGHLNIKYAQCSKKNNGRKIPYRVWMPKRRPKNSTFFKTSQICRVDWNWSDANFLHKWLFFVRFLVFEIWSILRNLAEI